MGSKKTYGLDPFCFDSLFGYTYECDIYEKKTKGSTILLKETTTFFGNRILDGASDMHVRTKFESDKKRKITLGLLNKFFELCMTQLLA